MKFAYLIEPPFNFLSETGEVTGCDVELAKACWRVSPSLALRFLIIRADQFLWGGSKLAAAGFATNAHQCLHSSKQGCPRSDR